ncbi:MAG TPA: anhydro-N-acetylmuramic acid kinase [bacterium]|nr:anhydro-N-acetylmuramic acid kinase [bacterium]
MSGRRRRTGRTPTRRVAARPTRAATRPHGVRLPSRAPSARTGTAAADLAAAIRAKTTKRIIGLISGTSADGITAALVEITDRLPAGRGRATGRRAPTEGAGHDHPKVRLVAHTTVPYPPEVRRRVIDVFTQPATTQEIASLHYLLGESFADAALAAAKRAGCPMTRVDLIASHGQTVAHVGVPDPSDPWSRAATMQLGESAVIAERTRRPVLADFRAADIAAGGQAAPFVPYADIVLLSAPHGRIALNLGGISNITVLPASGRRDDVYAFDCGPANMLIDGLVRHFSGGAETFDRDGARAARGTVREDLLRELLAHPFVNAPPPKTAGHEQFGRPFLDGLLATWGRLPADDLIATATAFAGDAVGRNVARYVVPRHAIADLVAAGGGVHNPALMHRLARAVAPIRVRRIDEFGVPADAKEALAFALLGHATLMGIPGNLPRVTGARHAAILGKWTWPPR